MKHAKVLGMAAVFAGSVALSTAASAAPIGFIPSAGLEGGSAIEKIMDGCGQGFSRDAYGRCYLRRGPPPYYGDGYGYRRRPPPPRDEYRGYDRGYDDGYRRPRPFY